jgi:hypothetical protein
MITAPTITRPGDRAGPLIDKLTSKASLVTQKADICDVQATNAYETNFHSSRWPVKQLAGALLSLVN